MKKTVYLVLGESGSGKTTIVNAICDRWYRYTSLDSYTTRPPRYDGESGHTFVDENTYQLHKSNNDICAFTEFNGYKYWATYTQLNTNTFYVIDQDGINYLKSKCGDKYNFKIIYITTPILRRLYRMLKRDGLKKTISRYINDLKMFRNLTYDYKIINKNLGESISQVENIIKGDK